MDVVLNLISDLFAEIRFRLYYEPVFHRFLNHKYRYYPNLPATEKGRFLRLVRDHYEYFEFVSREKLKLTRVMKAIISCAASQLVFRLPEESLTFYKRIIVYPDDYLSTVTNRLHRGEVNPGMRIIVFSWRGIMEGLNPPDDGLNLLLHEFAHALWLEHKLMGKKYTVLDETMIALFERQAEDEMTRLHAYEKHFFRAYAFSNIEEFFAVAVENFFERPRRFKEQIPQMYATLVLLFGQDPLEYEMKTSKK